MQVGSLKLKAQLLCDGEIAMGPGKADLLEAIPATGSISAAGRSLGMSYRRGWLLVDSMNRCWSDRLVDAVAGGGEGRGARLTPLGTEVLRRYRALEERLATIAADELAALEALMRATPLPTRTERAGQA